MSNDPDHDLRQHLARLEGDCRKTTGIDKPLPQPPRMPTANDIMAQMQAISARFGLGGTLTPMRIMVAPGSRRLTWRERFNLHRGWSQFWFSPFEPWRKWTPGPLIKDGEVLHIKGVGWVCTAATLAEIERRVVRGEGLPIPGVIC